MNQRWTAVFTAFLVFLAAFPGARAKTVDEIALVADGDSMTQSELDEAVQNYFLFQRLKVPDPQSAAYQDALKQVMDDFIQQVLLAEEADRQKIMVTEGELDHAINQQIEGMKKNFASEQDFLDGLDKEGITQDELRQSVRKNLSRKMKSVRALRAKQEELPQKNLVTDEQARAFYEQHSLDYEQAKFSMILFRIPPDSKPAYAKEVQAQASQVLKELRAGADFAAYAKKYSEDPGSAEKGGDVGSVYRSQMPPSLAKGIFSIPERNMGIVKTPDAVYIVKLDSKGKTDYASVASNIKESLKKESLDAALKAWLRVLRKKAYVEYHHKLLPPDAGTPTAAAPSPSATPTEEENQVQVFSTAPVEPGGSLGNNLIPGATSEISQSSGISNLPEEGSLSLNLRLGGWLYNTQDLSNYYGSNFGGFLASTGQNFPFGYDAVLGLDLAVDPNFQAGIMVSALIKTTETVPTSKPQTINSPGSETDQWSERVLGASLEAKLIFPLEDGVNAILGGSGGYFFLISSDLNTGAIDYPLEGGGFGAEGHGTVEFFLDAMKATALDIEGGYRYLQITATGFPTGAQQALEFSGFEAGLGLKIYLGK